MRFLGVFGVFFCAVALAKDYKEFGIITPEELQPESGPERIIQGSPAAANQFPHQGYLIILKRFSCGASLISTRWAITAAHCLEGGISATLFLGHIRLASTRTKVLSNKLRVHPNYDPKNLNNDIALLGWDWDVPLGVSIRPIALAKDPNANYAGRIVTASGFGRIADKGFGSPTLRYVQLKVITNAVCKRTFRSVIPSTICATGITSYAQGVCSGDSGGPLTLGNGTRATLVGVVSFVHKNGCSLGAPSGFVRPNHFVPWIKSVTGLRFDKD